MQSLVPARFGKQGFKVHLASAVVSGAHIRPKSNRPLCGTHIQGLSTVSFTNEMVDCEKCLAIVKAHKQTMKPYVPSYGSATHPKPYTPSYGVSVSDEQPPVEEVSKSGFVIAYTLVPMARIPKPHHLFRDMERYRAVNWKAATTMALNALQQSNKPYEAVALCRSKAAASLIADPVKLEAGSATLTNGQHGTQAMREQALGFVVARVTRDVDQEPLGREFLIEYFG